MVEFPEIGRPSCFKWRDWIAGSTFEMLSMSGKEEWKMKTSRKIYDFCRSESIMDKNNRRKHIENLNEGRK